MTAFGNITQCSQCFLHVLDIFYEVYNAIKMRYNLLENTVHLFPRLFGFIFAVLENGDSSVFMEKSCPKATFCCSVDLEVLYKTPSANPSRTFTVLILHVTHSPLSALTFQFAFSLKQGSSNKWTVFDPLRHLCS